MLFYDNYLDNMSKTPKESIKDFQQAYINSWWDLGTLQDVIGEETYNGSFKFENIDVWVNSIGEFTVQISKNERDYRRFMFKDQNHSVNRGRLYNYMNNYWITYDTTDPKEPYCEIYTRRCNNWLKWVDRDNGALYEVPCVLDYEVGSPTPQRSKTIELPNGHVVLWVQANEKTRKIKKNQRFIFNGDPYKFTSYNAYLQDDYIDENIPMLYMDLYLDEIQPSDDIENNIANKFEINYDIKISQDDFTSPQGSIGKLDATITFNNDTVGGNIQWESLNDNIEINSDGEYILIGENGTQGTIRAYIKDNDDIYDEINININNGLNQKELVFEPYYDEISQYETIEFNVNVYIDGQKQTDSVDVTINNLDSTYYEFVRTNNSFKLTSKKVSKNPLSLTFSSGDIQKTINIKFKSLF